MGNEEVLDDYRLFVSGESICLDHGWVAIELSGRDRVSFLHGFCTADIKSMTENESREAFVLNPKGKTIALVQVAVFTDKIVLLAGKMVADQLVEHLSKYQIVEDVELQLAVAPVAIASRPVSALDANPFAIPISSSSCFYLVTQAAIEESKQAGLAMCCREAFEMFRVENGYPFAQDVGEDHLAQEFDKDATAISFTKGCYLGQETVARLDALGHTNRQFVRIGLGQAENLEVGVNIQAGEDQKTIGQLTSLAWSPQQNQWIGLATIRKPFHQAGKEVMVADHRANVIG